MNNEKFFCQYESLQYDVKEHMKVIKLFYCSTYSLKTLRQVHTQNALQN